MTSLRLFRAPLITSNVRQAAVEASAAPPALPVSHPDRGITGIQWNHGADTAS
jgi:hypothetical protein